MPAGPGQTPDERRAAIDRRLDDSLGTFDAALKKEQQANAHERDAHQAATAGTATTEAQPTDKSDSADASGSAATDTSQGSSDAADKRGNSDRKSSRPGDLKSEKSGAKGDDNAGNGAAAREIPDGSDDDVVARRLRKAAEQETDPELKDKLWREYVEYKKNAQGK